MKSFLVKVPQEIIDSAKPEYSSKCMVAQAIRRNIRNSYSVHVTAETVRFNVGDDKTVTGTRYLYPLPGVAIAAIRQFDIDRTKVRPFQFTLDGRSDFSMTAPVVKRGERGLNNKKKIKRKSAGKKRPASLRRCPVRRYRGAVALSGSA